MLIVLDTFALNKALTSDADEVRQTIIEVCDQIAITRRIREEYEKLGTFSSLIPELEKLEEIRPRKLATPRTRATVEISGLRRQHRAIVEDAVRIGANYLVTERELWLSLDKQLSEEHNLHIVNPVQYVAERRRQ